MKSGSLKQNAMSPIRDDDYDDGYRITAKRLVKGKDPKLS